MNREYSAVVMISRLDVDTHVRSVLSSGHIYPKNTFLILVSQCGHSQNGKCSVVSLKYGTLSMDEASYYMVVHDQPVRWSYRPNGTILYTIESGNMIMDATTDEMGNVERLDMAISMNGNGGGQDD